jgi:hypothetical protein
MVWTTDTSICADGGRPPSQIPAAARSRNAGQTILGHCRYAAVSAAQLFVALAWFLNAWAIYSAALTEQIASDSLRV